MVKDGYRSESLLKGCLDDKPQVDFVNETEETISSVCIGHFVPKDELGLKRIKGKRERPRKGCSESPAAPSAVPKDEPCEKREGEQKNIVVYVCTITPTVPKDQPGGRRRRGRPKRGCSESPVAPVSVVPLGKLGNKRKRGRMRGRKCASSAASSRSVSRQSHPMQVLESSRE
jgi:hypothetical protein